MKRANLLGLRTFHAIAKHGTLRAAAHSLGVQASAVSQQLKQFEDHLGTALFLRNTRSVVLTDAGEKLFRQTRHILSEADTAIEQLRSEAEDVSGTLRVTMPFRAWEAAVAPRLCTFQQKFPRIKLDLSIDEDLVDIVAEGIHAGVRLGDFLQNQMIAKAISPPMIGAYLASSAYLEQFGTPKHPIDLLEHNCLQHRQIGSGKCAAWEFVVDGKHQTVDALGSIVFDDLRTIVDATIRGFGIGWSLKSGVLNELATGQLTQVLEEFTPDRPSFYIYFPRELRDLPRLRAFVDHFGSI